MENQNNKNQDEIKISKKSLYIGGAVVGVLILSALGYFVLGNKNPQKVTEAKTDSLAIKVDTANVAKIDSLGQNEEYNEGEAPYGEHIVIANSVSLPEGKLKFGDKVYVDYQKSDSRGQSIVYLNNPSQYPSAKSSPIAVSNDVIIDSYSFNDFKKYFSTEPYSSLPAGVKKVLMNENGTYRDGKTYYLTQNTQRAKSTLAIGDFDGDGMKDYAVLLDGIESGQESRLIIVSVNKNTKNAYVSYGSNFSDRLIMRAFQKGSSIYMNSSNFVKAPREGVILSNEWGALVVIYDSNAQKYKVYSQEPAEATADEVQE